jgi:hypothetical protein
LRPFSGVFLTACFKERKVSGVGVQVSAIKKFQITNHKDQTNYKERNSKSQTIDV